MFEKFFKYVAEVIDGVLRHSGEPGHSRSVETTNSWQYLASFSSSAKCARSMAILNVFKWSPKTNGILCLFVWWILMSVISFANEVFMVTARTCMKVPNLLLYGYLKWYHASWFEERGSSGLLHDLVPDWWERAVFLLSHYQRPRGWWFIDTKVLVCRFVYASCWGRHSIVVSSSPSWWRYM